jgi:hypothetical protein
MSVGRYPPPFRSDGLWSPSGDVYPFTVAHGLRSVALDPADGYLRARRLGTRERWRATNVVHSSAESGQVRRQHQDLVGVHEG